MKQEDLTLTCDMLKCLFIALGGIYTFYSLTKYFLFSDIISLRNYNEQTKN